MENKQENNDNSSSLDNIDEYGLRELNDTSSDTLSPKNNKIKSTQLCIHNKKTSTSVVDNINNNYNNNSILSNSNSHFYTNNNNNNNNNNDINRIHYDNDMELKENYSRIQLNKTKILIHNSNSKSLTILQNNSKKNITKNKSKKSKIKLKKINENNNKTVNDIKIELTKVPKLSRICLEIIYQNMSKYPNFDFLPQVWLPIIIHVLI